jgi:DNA-binding transcriptional LysR family regulator
MNDIQIKYFLELCEVLNFTKAARNLYISQPALSKQIALLEKEMDLKLFERTSKGVKLTSAGKVFYNFFSKIKKEYNLKLENLKKEKNIKDVTLIIGFLEAWDLTKYLREIAKNFEKIYPNVKLKFVSYNSKMLVNKLIYKEIDVAIGMSDFFVKEKNLIIRNIDYINRLLFYSSEHKFSKKNDLKMKDFKDDTFFVFKGESRINTQEKVKEICSIFGFEPKITVVPNVESMVLHVESGLGVALFDEWIRYKNNQLLGYIKVGHRHKIDAAYVSGNNNEDYIKKIIEEFLKISNRNQ